jgi:hypothetical protein
MKGKNSISLNIFATNITDWTKIQLLLSIKD